MQAVAGSTRAMPTPSVGPPTAEADDIFGVAYVEQAATVRAALLPLLRPPATPAALTRLRTCVRIRPPLAREIAAYGLPIAGLSRASFAQLEYEACFADRSTGEVVVLSEERVIGQPTGQLEEHRAAADETFGDGDSDEIVFERTVRPLVERTLTTRAGSTFCGRSALLAFGQTGAGKTHTCVAMQARAAAALLDGPGVAALGVSFLEICGEQIVDLLTTRFEREDGDGDEGDGDGGQGDGGEGDGGTDGPLPPPSIPPQPMPSLALREAAGGELTVVGWQEVTVHSAHAAIEVLAAANRRRAAAPTAANERSSRSHAICRLRPLASACAVDVADAPGLAGAADVADGTDAVGGVAANDAPTAASSANAERDTNAERGANAVRGANCAIMLIVDCAGSERREDVLTHGKVRMEETRAANTSLAALKECIRLESERASRDGRGGGSGGGGSGGSGGGGGGGGGDGGGSGGSGGSVVPYRRSKLTRLLRPYLERPRPVADDADSPPPPLCHVLAHLSPTRSAGKHTASTLEFVHALRGSSRQARELSRFNRVERWTPAEVMHWVDGLDGGVYAHLRMCFAGFTGKLLSVEWIGHLVKRVRAEGGDEAEAHRIYDAFHVELQAARAEAREVEAAEEAARDEGRTRTAARPSGFAAARRAAKAKMGAAGCAVEIREGPKRTGRINVESASIWHQ